MTTFSVGDTIEPDQLTQLPGRSVVIDPLGRPRMLNSRPHSYLFTDTSAVAVGQYTVIFIPEPAKDPETTKLAEELWGVRNKTLAPGMEPVVFGSWPLHVEVYEALAEFVRSNFTRKGPGLLPRTIIAGDDEIWTLRENGKYSIADPEGWTTRTEIERYDGIKREIA